MKRLILSVICGFLFPFLYTCIVGPLSTYTENETLNFFCSLPVRWPVVLLAKVVGYEAFPFRDGEEISFLVYVIAADVALYSVLAYSALWFIAKARRKPKELAPPPPPEVLSRG